MPRPRKYDEPMTAAARAREYRARRFERQRVAMRKPSDATVRALLDELRDCVAQGQVEGATAVSDELLARVKRNASR